MQYKMIPVTSFVQNCTLLWCDKTKKAVVVDPGGEAERLIAAIDELEISVERVLITHGHLDHVGAVKAIADHFDVDIYGPSKEDTFWLSRLSQQSEQFGLPTCLPFEPDHWLKEGDQIHVGGHCLDILHCPGHTPGHIVFVNKQSRLVLVGDVLFYRGIGRTDFPMSSLPMLLDSITRKLLPLGSDFTFIPGHGPTSTFGSERQYNPYLQQC